ncbi:PAK-2p27 [Dactylellina cionopaga]|nr:PAK-2p27 [Dactylellina cionopaga]
MSAQESSPSIHADSQPPNPANSSDLAVDSASTAVHFPNLRTLSDPTTDASHPLGAINVARRPGPAPFSPSSSPVVPTSASTTTKAELPRDAKDMQAILKAFHQKRQHSMTSSNTPTLSTATAGGAFIGGATFNPTGSPRMNRPNAPNWQSSPAAPSPPQKQSLGFRRGLKLPGGLPPATTTPVLTASGGTTGSTNGGDPAAGSLFNKFSNYVDTATGSLKFAGKAVIHGKGVDFSSGSTFRISLDELESLDELGKGNYGTVYKVIHRKPSVRVPGAGVAAALGKPTSSPEEQSKDDHLSGVVMAMKEIRLELDEAKFAAIIMELDILHRCVSSYIIDFYGAFFQEGAVYICIEWMDGGSMDKLYGDGVPESVLKKVTWATVMGLKYLKEEHNIIHRDVKPTNILVNTKGDVKLCDFGVSGNLVASIAKTNIGCQSYMAPERIATGGMAQAGNKDGTYSVQSDIWSLGLSILECAMGRYPYPPETYNNIFSQLSAIVDGPPPDLPEEGFSPQARDFVRRTLHKTPKMRPTYAALLQHPWLGEMQTNQTIAEEDEDEEDGQATPQVEQPPAPVTRGFPEVSEWVITQLKKREEKLREGGKWGSAKPALHSVALDKVVSPVRETPFDVEEREAESLADGMGELTVNS